MSWVKLRRIIDIHRATGVTTVTSEITYPMPTLHGDDIIAWLLINMPGWIFIQQTEQCPTEGDNDEGVAF